MLDKEDTEKLLPEGGDDTSTKLEIQRPAASTARGQGQTPPLQISWQNLTCAVSGSDGKDTMILDNLTGCANSGESVGIMGPSGSGKTTLLTLLAGRHVISKGIKVIGSIELNQTDIKTIPYKEIVGYVTQNDVLMSTLSPKETLMFSLFMRTRLCSADRERKVSESMKMLKIEHIADNLIGLDFNQGISGGERKRLCIGVELIVSPLILLLDEPTSGLDSTTARLIMDLLNNEAAEGRVIIYTIHQPSTEIFEKIGKLVLLSQGHFVYQGPTKESRNFFDSAGFPCSEYVNPGDHYMTVLFIQNRLMKTQEETETLDKLLTQYNDTQYTITQFGSPELVPTLIEEASLKVPSQARKALALIKRAFANSFRNEALTGMKIGQVITIGFLLASLYWDLDDDYDSFQERNGLFMYMVIGLIFGSAQVSILACKFYTVPAERGIFKKECGQGMYNSTVFFICKMVSELPFNFVVPWIMLGMIYWSVGLNDDSFSKYANYCKLYVGLIIFLANMSGVTFGYLMGSLFKDVTVAVAAFSTITYPLMGIAGFTVTIDSLDDSISWLRFASMFFYGIEALNINEYEDLDMDCDCDSGNESCDCDFLGLLGFDDDELWEPIMGQVALIVAYLLLTGIVLHLYSKSL